jgi:prefoldin alpha subunit
LASGKKLTEKDIQNIAMQHQQMQYQAEGLMQQVNMVGMSIDESKRAINSINELEGMEDGHEILVPIGSNTNVRANLVKPDGVIIEIGAGISMEKKLEDAKVSLEKQNKELTLYQQNLQESLNQIISKMKEMEAVVQAATQQKQQTQTRQPMQGS